MCIERYLSKDNFERMKEDFGFLIGKIIDSAGELDLSIRNNYFNIYYKGNSLAKVTFKSNGLYKIEINKKFFVGSKASKDKRFNYVVKNDYAVLNLTSELLNPLFQVTYLDDFKSKIKEENFGEEITREQAIITDNMNRKNLIFIDRQITDSKLKGKTMDLLALKRDDSRSELNDDTYNFVVIEVKRGDNKELEDDVYNQIKLYSNHIRSNFESYKCCYEKQYFQKKELGLLAENAPAKVDINLPVEEWIVVVGYSGLANQQIKKFKKNHKDIPVKQLTYRIDL